MDIQKITDSLDITDGWSSVPKYRGKYLTIIGSGIFKRVFLINRQLVLKIGKRDHVESEYNIYQNTNSPSLKKHLARCYYLGYIDSSIFAYIIQERCVRIEKPSVYKFYCKQKRSVDRTIASLNLTDITIAKDNVINVGIRDNLVKIFDFGLVHYTL
jgi:hypothetical protein